MTAGRRRLFEVNGRPSPKGNLPLADWLVPVHYLERDVSFPMAQSRNDSGLSAEVASWMSHLPGDTPGADGDLAPVGNFVGRDDLVYELESAASAKRAVLLHGPAGSGKTELAKAFARWWRRTGGVDRPEWIFWHSFEPGAASFGLDGVINEIGLAILGPDFAQRDARDRLLVIERMLSEKRLLLIWDNFETVASMPGSAALSEADRAEFRNFLARTAADSKGLVIITSRTQEPWLGEIGRIAVGGLTDEDAIEYADQLLASRPAAASRREQAAFGELLEWLDGHPLSMRLILPQLDTADPETLLAGLRGTIPLANAEDGDEQGRTMSLTMSISYSFNHLARQTRRLLPALSLFHGVADADLLATFSQGDNGPFAGANAQDWTAALDDAARVGLLTPHAAGVYKIHPALPTYLAAQWRAECPDRYEIMRNAAAREVVAACAALGRWLRREIHSGDASWAYEVIGQHEQTLRWSLSFAAENGLWRDADTISQPFYNYLEVRGRARMADALTNRLLIAIAETEGDPPDLNSPARALWGFLASVDAARQKAGFRLAEAEQAYRRLLDMAEAEPVSPSQQKDLAATYHQLGYIAQDRWRLREAEDWHLKALAICEDLGDKSGLADSCHHLGMVAQDQGRLNDAEDWYLRSLGLRENPGEFGVAATCHEMGRLAQTRWRLEDAPVWYLKALAIFEDLGDPLHMASTLHQLGVAAFSEDKLSQAQAWYLSSLEIRERLGDAAGMKDSYLQLGRLALLRGDFDEANAWQHKTLAVNEERGDRAAIADSYHQLAIVALAQGNLDVAEDW